MEKIRIVLVDDHPIVRQGLRQMISIDDSLEIVGEAGDGEEALILIETEKPDVAVVDIDMPRMDGFSLSRELRRRAIDVEIIFLTMHSEEEIFQEAIDLGAKGYVLKDSAVNDITASIKSVATGKPFISPALSIHLLNLSRSPVEPSKQQKALDSLSPMERKILKLIAEDNTSRDIGDQLFISYRTVETHRSNICRKLDLRGSLALVKFAAANRSDI